MAITIKKYIDKDYLISKFIIDENLKITDNDFEKYIEISSRRINILTGNWIQKNLQDGTIIIDPNDTSNDTDLTDAIKYNTGRYVLWFIENGIEPSEKIVNMSFGGQSSNINPNYLESWLLMEQQIAEALSNQGIDVNISFGNIEIANEKNLNTPYTDPNICLTEMGLFQRLVDKNWFTVETPLKLEAKIPNAFSKGIKLSINGTTFEIILPFFDSAADFQASSPKDGDIAYTNDYIGDGSNITALMLKEANGITGFPNKNYIDNNTSREKIYSENKKIFQEGKNITLAYDDNNNTITINGGDVDGIKFYDTGASFQSGSQLGEIGWTNNFSGNNETAMMINDGGIIKVLYDYEFLKKNLESENKIYNLDNGNDISEIYNKDLQYFNAKTAYTGKWLYFRNMTPRPKTDPIPDIKYYNGFASRERDYYGTNRTFLTNVNLEIRKNGIISWITGELMIAEFDGVRRRWPDLEHIITTEGLDKISSDELLPKYILDKYYKTPPIVKKYFQTARTTAFADFIKPTNSKIEIISVEIHSSASPFLLLRDIDITENYGTSNGDELSINRNNAAGTYLINYTPSPNPPLMSLMIRYYDI